MAENVVDVLLRARADMSQVTGSIGDLQRQFQKLTLPKGISDNLEKSFSKLTPLIKEYQKILSKESFTPKDTKNLEILKGKISSVYNEILSETNKVNSQEIRIKADVSGIEKASKNVSKLKTELDNAMKSISNTISNKNINYNLDKLFNVKRINTTKIPDFISQAKNLLKAGSFQEYNNKIDEMRNKMLSLTSVKYSFAENLGLKDAEQHITQADKKITDFFNHLKLNGQKIGSITDLRQQLAEAEAELERLNFKSVDDGSKAFVNAKTRVQELRTALNQVAKSAEPAAASMSRMQSEIQSLQSTTQYFFGLRNMFNLLKRGINEALQTVKDLDAAMTETAVVTNFSVGDMWEKLPEYTANANALGASVQDMYEATTLYYQQGLNAQQAMSIASETMKMARIGGLEAAEATDMMTAALRGFNMELNEVSAQRINDVYSNLAAKTASNTEELGTAMQRTASIAHSAGMSFEGTAAFLAQAIETTREPAENLGTAMKTIVARFQELKKNPLEVTEVDGEEVSYNKVDEALQTIGVDLKDVNGQFRDLDQVFLEISQKWNSLTQTQQRYIATTAAGSRQQSRFIAMMSNYERTVQLMEYANDSSGASNEQFGKTLESLEAKLNKLQNAWKEFLMGITDSNLFKGIVDGLTTTLNVVNGIINKLSLGNGAIKSFLSLFVAFKTLSVGGRLANNFIGGIGGILTGAGFMGGYRQAAGKYNAGSRGQDVTLAGRISTPIVLKLGEVIAAIKQQKAQTTKNANSTVADYKAAAAAFHNVGTPYSKISTMGQVGSMFNNLSNEHGRAVLVNNPGTTSVLNKTSQNWFSKIAKQLNLDVDTQKTGQQLMKGIYKGMRKGQISPKEGMKLLGKPELWGSYFGTEVAEQFSRKFAKQNKIFKQQQRQQQQQQMAAAREQAWVETGNKLLAPGERERYYKSDADFRKKYNAIYKRIRKQQPQLQSTNLSTLGKESVGTQTTINKLSNTVGTLGSKFTGAGYSIQMFGQQLGMLSPALAGVGNMISTVGAGVTSLGMAISGIGRSFEGLETLFGALGTGPALLGIAAIAAAVGALAYDIKKVKDIKKAAKDVVDSFDEINKSSTDNINNLEQWRGELATLAEGVDQNGNNVLLDTGDYDRYREIVNSIAEINPAIVKGFNAQGDAIIDNNTALEQTLNLQKQIRKEATTKYTSNRSLNKLIEAREEDERLYESKKGLKVKRTTGTNSDLIHTLKGEINFDLLNEQLGFNIQEASEGMIARNYQAIEKAIQLQLGDSMPKNIGKKLDAFVEAQEDRIEAGKDIYKLLSTYAQQQRYTAVVPEELLGEYENALKNEAIDARSSEEAKRFARQEAKRMKALGGEGSEAGKLFKIIRDAQTQFNKDFKEEEYLDTINKNAIPQLKTLSEEYKNSGDQTKQAFAETIDNMIAKAQTYTKEGGKDLLKSFDSTKSAIDAMTSAYEEFKKALEGGNLKNATDSLKNISDEMYSGTNAKWGGGPAYWAGAKYFISDDLYRSGNFEETDKIVKGILPILEDTEQGYIASLDYLGGLAKDLQGTKWEDVLTPTADGGFDIKNLTTEAMEGIANFKKLNPDMLRTIFKKASRIDSNIQTWDPELLKQSYIGDERAYLKEGTNGKEGEVYIKQGEFENDLIEQDIVPKQWDKIKEDAKEVGINLLPDTLIDEQTKKLSKQATEEIEKAGINTDNYMSELIKRGYNEEDVLAYGEEKTGKSREELQAEYNDTILSLEDPVSSISDKASETVSLLNAIYGVLGGGNLGEGTARDSDFLGSKIYDETFGTKGETTEIEQIHAGKDREGNELTPETYKDAKQFANEQISASMDYLHEVRQGLKKATQNGDKEQIAKYTEDVKKAEEAYNYRVEAANNLTKTWAEKTNEWQGFTDTPENYYNQRYGFIEGDPMIQLIAGGLLQKVLPEGNSWFGAFGTKTEGDSPVYSEYDLSGLKNSTDEAVKAVNNASKSVETETSKKDKESKKESKKEPEKESKKENQPTIQEYMATHYKIPGLYPGGIPFKPQIGVPNGIPPQFYSQNKTFGSGARTAYQDFRSQVEERANGPFPGGKNIGKTQAVVLNWILSQLDKVFSSTDKTFGNTDINNRQPINWGAEPYKQGKNWDNAQSWGFTEDDLRNKTSTFMSTGLGFMDAQGQVELAVTPMLQGADGTPQVLDKNTVQQYLDTITQQATNNQGVIDFDQLMQIDKQGVEIEGQQIHDLLMGAFRGEGAIEDSNALTNLEHGIEETKNSTVNGVQAINQILGETIQKTAEAQEGINNYMDSSPSSVPQPSSSETIDTGTAAVQEIAFQVTGKDEAEGEIQSVKDSANEGATLDVKATADSSINKTLKAVEGLKKASSKKQTANVGVDVSGTDKISGFANTLKNVKSKVVKITTSIPDLPKVKTLNTELNKLPRTKTISINIKKSGSVPNNFYTGTNNKISYHHVPTAGSLAGGTKKGRVGPRNRGGLTLTGELGYEIAWIPSQGKSAILGANGPQMVNLPKDATVYNHEQSKEIMKKRNGIPAGSLYNPPATKEVQDTHVGPWKSTSSGSSNKGNKGNKGNNNNNNKDSKKAAKQIVKVSAWWENIARETEATQRLMNKNAKAFEKYIKELRATLQKTGEAIESGGGGGDSYFANMKKYKQLNEQQFAQAKKDLENLDTSDSKTSISYKKGSKTKKEKVKLSKYIKYNDQLGIYEIDEDALKKVGNKNKAKAIKEQADKKLNEKYSKYYTAEDNKEKAEEELEKFREALYNSFFAWETELTKIWNITQKIAETEARINRTKSYTELLDAQISSGLQTATEEFAQQSIDAFSAGIYQQKESLKENIDALNQEREDLKHSLTLDDEKATLENIKNILINDKNSGYKNLNDTQREGYYEWAERLEKKINVQDEAWKYLTVAQKDDGTLDVNFDNAKFKGAQTAGLINEETAKEIETYVKSLTDQSGAINERLDKINSSTAEFYTQLASLKDEWADYANQLWDISDAEQKKEIDELKKLSDSLDKAFKDLLDGVKRKLDERRQQEDNLKTEREISQKQQRLAMLQADTSGGHQTEIAQLRQEIADSQQDYQRTLEDQTLEKLQEQADRAIQQREQQIALQEGTIDAVNNASLVNQWLADPTNPENKQAMYEAFMTANEADKKPDAIKEQLERQFEALYLGITTNKEKQDALYTSEESKKSIINEIQDGTIKMSNWSGQDKGILDTINESINSISVGGASTSLKNPGGVSEGGVKTAVSQAGNSGGGNSGGNSNSQSAAPKAGQYNKYGAVQKDTNDKTPNGSKKTKAVQYALNQLMGAGLKVDGNFGPKTIAAVKKFQKKYNLTVDGRVGPKTAAKFNSMGYKTGGLADYTGPAWLDGTPSKPELVLNSTDTKNFIALKDVLSKAMGSTNAIENTYGGDTTFEININVDHLNNDYDVDKVAERVKKIIVKDSSYRNVTQVRNFR